MAAPTYARVYTVEERILGSVLAADAAIGASTLSVAEAGDFDESGVILINGTNQYSYSFFDADASVITLVGTLAENHFQDEDVQMMPLSTERIAWVVGSDNPEDDEQLPARVPLPMFDKLPVGARDWSVGAGETVELRYSGDELVVVDVTGQVPAIDSAYLDTTNLDLTGVDGSGLVGVTATAASDGATPATPTVTLKAGPGWIQAQWNPPGGTADPLIYKVYVKNAAAPTPSGTTDLQATTAANNIVISKFPDGTTVTDLSDVHVRVVAESYLSAIDGTASTDVNDTPLALDGSVYTISNLNAGAIIAGSLDTARIGAGTINADLVLGGTFETSINNPKMVFDSSGISSYDAVGTKVLFIPNVGTAKFTGDIITGNIQIGGNLTISGTTNVMNQASQLTLNEGFQDPSTAPVVSTYISDYFGVDASNNNNFYNTSHCSLVYNANGSPSGTVKTWSALAAVFNEFGAHTANLQEWDYTTPDTALRNLRFSATWNASQWIGTGIVSTNQWCGFITATNKIRMIAIDTATWTEPGAAVTLDNGPVSTAQGMAFASDGTDLFVIDWAGTGTSKIRIRSFNTSGTLLSTTTTTGGIAFNNSNTPTIKSAVWDGSNWWIGFTLNTPTENHFSNNNWYVEKYNAGAYVSGSKAYYSGDVTKPSNAGFGEAMGWDGNASRLVNLGNETLIIKYSDIEWTSGSDKWYVAYRWNDGGTGHTLLSPLSAALDLQTGVSGAPAQRLNYLIEVPTFPVGATKVDVFILNASSPPAATTLKQQTVSGGWVNTDTVVEIQLLHYNSSGSVFSPYTNTFAGGTSDIVGTFSAGTPWKIGGDGTFVLPVWTTAHRITGLTGQLGYNSSNKALELYDGANPYSIWMSRDTEDVYDAILGLAGGTGLGGDGTGNMPIAYTLDPEAVNWSLTYAAGDCRGAAFMVKRQVTTAIAGLFIDLGTSGGLTNYAGFTLFSLNSSGDWVFIANTGATLGTGSTNTAGWMQANWRDSGDTANQSYTLVPGTVYVIAYTTGTYGTRNIKVAGYNPGATNVLATPTNLINFGTSFTTKPQRNAQTAAAKTAKITSNITVANLASQTFIPLYALW